MIITTINNYTKGKIMAKTISSINSDFGAEWIIFIDASESIHQFDCSESLVEGM
jgi:hypothetical protein